MIQKANELAAKLLDSDLLSMRVGKVQGAFAKVRV